MVMKLPLWHCPTAIHLSTACQPAYVCNCLPPNNHHCLSTHPPPSLVPSRRFRYPHTLHTHTSFPHPLPVSVSPSAPVLVSRSGLSKPVQLSIFEPALSRRTKPLTHTQPNTHTHTHTHRRIIPLFLFLSSFLSFFPPFFHLPSLCLSLCHPTSPSLSHSLSSVSSVLCLLSYTCPNLFHLISPPQWPCAN